PIPAAHGNLYLTLSGPDRFDPKKNATRVSLRMLGEDRPLVDLGDPAGFDMPADPWAPAAGRGATDPGFLSPDAKAMVVLSGAGDKLVVHSIDIETLLEKAGIDYLFVASRPSAAVRGTTFTYKPDVKSKKGGVKVKLDAGPDGMKVAADGTVT